MGYVRRYGRFVDVLWGSKDDRTIWIFVLERESSGDHFKTTPVSFEQELSQIWAIWRFQFGKYFVAKLSFGWNLRCDFGDVGVEIMGF